MKNLFLFFKALLQHVKEDDIISISYQLTYKLMVSVFPFIIFLMTILGFLDIDGQELIDQFAESLPPEILEVIVTFVNEVIFERHLSILSTSLIVSIISSSSGFYSVIRGINKSYGQDETRSAIRVRLTSIALVFIFTLIIIFSSVLLIFRNTILKAINYYFMPSYFTLRLFDALGFLTALVVIMIAMLLMYKISSCKKVKFINVMPGAIFAVAGFSLVSKAFSIYIDNFTNYSVVYGSIGSIFVMMLWLNLISIILLVGSEVNALLEVKDKTT